MFYVTAQVGSLYAVHDDADGSVEWFSKGQLSEYLRAGVQIEGASLSTIIPVKGRRVPFNFCNWTKTKRNIFEVCQRVSITGRTLTIVAEGKKFKGRLIDKNASGVDVLFSNGLCVSIPLSFFERWS